MARATTAAAAPVPGGTTTSDTESAVSAVDDFLGGAEADSAEEDPGDDAEEDAPPTGEDDGTGEEDAEEASDGSATEPKPAGRPPKVEKVRVNDGTGSREVDVDFTDRAAMKRYVQQAHGAMKLYRRERQAQEALVEAKKSAEAVAERAKIADDYEEIYATEGADGILKTLTKKSIDEHIAERVARSRFLADPKQTLEAKEAFLRKEAQDEVARQRGIDKAKADRVDTAAKNDRKEAERLRMEATVHPQFEKIRFAGKLGDPAREHRLDSMIWNEAVRELDSMETAGVKDFTPEIVAGVFRDARDTLGVVIEQQATKKADELRRKQKTKAQNAVASEARRGAESLAKQANAAPSDEDYLDPSRLAAMMFAQTRRRR